MANLSLALAWCYRFLSEIGPILAAVNAAWSLFNKVYSLIKGRKQNKGSD